MKSAGKPAKVASKPTAKSAAKPKAKTAAKSAAKPAAKGAAKAAKTAAKPATAAASSAKPVIVGKLVDWPLGVRLAKLLDLPASATELACVQVLGGHGPAVLELLGATPSVADSAIVARVNAALDACTKNQAAIVKSTQLVHPTLAPEEIAARLGAAFRVMSPAEAHAARKKSPAQSLSRIEKNLADLQGLEVPRKAVIAWLEGKGKITSVLGANADVLGRAMASEPEAYNEIDEQLFALWVQRLNPFTGFPWPNPNDLEYGFERRTAYLDKMVAAGMDRTGAEDSMLGRWSERVRTWPSTGIWVWEALVADAHALSKRVLGLEDGANRLRFVLGSVLELPKSTLEAGALDVVKKVCADSSLVPDETMQRLLADSGYRALLGTIARSGA
ncbi:Hypothetical protein A7982_04249 [Minicystis rosea]|nr:Hypothetical protein A7982_04249 [Minicystis rosea]